MGMAVALVVESSPENVRANPRALGLCAGVDAHGTVFVRCSSTVLDARHLAASSAAAEWLHDVRAARWHAVLASAGGQQVPLVLDALVPLGHCGSSGTGLLVLCPTDAVELPIDAAFDALGLQQPGWFVCGFPFGSTDVGCCVFPVADVVPHPCGGVVRVCAVLCEGLEGAPVVSVAPGQSTPRLCGILLRATSGAAWCPRAEPPRPVLPPSAPNTDDTTAAAALGVVGLVGNSDSTWASGVVLAAAGAHAVVATCAHVVRRCPRMHVWCGGRCVGAGVAVRASPRADIAVVAVACAVPGVLVACRCRAATSAAPPPQPGEPVATVGHHDTPPCVPAAVRRGVVVRWDARSATATTTCAAAPGSSGGALVDRAGRVLGVQCRTLTGRTGAILAQAHSILDVLTLAGPSLGFLHLTD